MVVTKGDKKSANLEEDSAAEDGSADKHSDSPTADVLEPNEDAQSDDEQGKSSNNGEVSGEEGEKAAEAGNEDPLVPVTETNGDNKAELRENSFEDDGKNEYENMAWGIEEWTFDHNNEDKVLDEFKDSEDEATDEVDEDDEGSEGEANNEEVEASEEEANEEDEVSDEEAAEEKSNKEEAENANQDTKEASAKQDGREDKKDDPERSKASLKNIKMLKERSKKKKVQAGGLKKMESEDKPESSSKKKAKKRVQSMGMIFMCSSETKEDCYKYMILGLPESKKDIVEKIYAGMRLFLYDLDQKLMHGIYKAAGPGGYNIEPKAFKSQFPSQVRFKVMENCLPLAEEKFKKVIKDNYFTKNKFDCQLNSEQVKNLCRLFSASKKGRPSKKLALSPKAEKSIVRRDRIKRQRTGNKKRPPVRENVKRHERPRKRPRKVMSPVPPSRQRLPPPLSSTVPSSYAYERASDGNAYRRHSYVEIRSPYRERRDRPLIPIDSYGGARDPPIERSERYRDGRDPHPLERHYSYSGGRDPYIDDLGSHPRSHDPYRDGRAPYIDSRDIYRDGLDPYTERRDSYRDGRDPYIERRDSLRDGRASYLERRVPYGGSGNSELYNTYRRLPLSDSRDVYGDDRGSYRRDELLVHRDQLPIGSYVSNRERAPYGESLYPTAYASRAGLYRL